MSVTGQTDPAQASASPVEPRAQFHRDLEALEEQIEAQATLTRHALDTSRRALAAADTALFDAVVAGDDEVDERHRQIEQRAIDLVARQQPVASDLRLLVALIHTSLHLERIGDMAVNVAEAGRVAVSLPANARILQHLDEMAHLAGLMTDLAVQAFRRRDRAACEQLPELDERIDQLNRNMINHVLACADAPDHLEWAIRMFQVSRYLERAADHAVDIAEQAWFLITGELRELD